LVNEAIGPDSPALDPADPDTMTRLKDQLDQDLEQTPRGASTAIR